MAFGESSLHPADYVVFVAMLVAALGIGLYHALIGGQRTTGHYLMGNRQMGLLPVTASMLMTFMSTSTVLGYPTEMYAFGVQYGLTIVSGALGTVLACYVFLPVLYPLKITSVNEYLGMRFESKSVKYVGCVCALTGMVFYGGNVLFGPCTALEAMSGIPSWLSIVTCGCVGILYTTIGGFKAVIWTDVFQCFLLFFGMIVVLVTGILSVGSFEAIWKHLDQWGRLNLFDFDPEPTKRMNFYGVMFAVAINFTGYYGYLQLGVQRYCSLPTMEKARKSVMGVIPGNIFIIALSFACGMVVFAHYANVGCDPKHAGQITNYNQILPYYVVDVINIPTFPGMFLSSLLAASLSTLSSTLNSSAALLWTDVIKDKFPAIPEARATLINKVIVVCTGVVNMAVALAIDSSGGTVMQISSTFQAATGGPSFGLFLCAVLVPWVNWKGAIAGVVVGMSCGIWLTTGSFMTAKNWQPLDSPNNCSSMYFDNFTTPSSWYMETTSPPPTTVDFLENERTGLQSLYSISFLWYRDIIAGVTVVIAILVSLVTGVKKPQSTPGNLVHPCWKRTLQFAPDVPLPTQEYTRVDMEMTTKANSET